MWEKKTGISNTGVFCSTSTMCNEPSDVNNLYNWNNTGGAAPNGTLFTNFLAKMNCTIAVGNPPAGGGPLGTEACGAGPYSDWRIPTAAELRTILTAEYPNCLASPCIDPIFGPTQEGRYWTSTTAAGIGFSAWWVVFESGAVTANVDCLYCAAFARAVRVEGKDH
jgi:hypothetical protein